MSKWELSTQQASPMSKCKEPALHVYLLRVSENYDEKCCFLK